MNQPCVLALGFFDGVHLGHGGLLQKTRQVADRLGLPAAALTSSSLLRASMASRCACVHCGMMIPP